MTILHIDSSITGDASVSRTISAAIVARLAAADPAVTVVRRDLVADPLPHLDLAALPGDGSDAARRSEAVLAEFLAADTVVIGAAMYNFTIPSQLKAWIDRVAIAGRSFRYTANGPEGLAGHVRVIVALSRGGVYGPDAAAAEHAETYLKALFGFIGIVPEFVIAEGIALGAEQRDAAIAGALAEVERLAA